MKFSGKNVLITGSLTVLGGISVSKDIIVGGTMTCSSDINLKDNIEIISENILSKIGLSFYELRLRIAIQSVIFSLLKF